MGPGPWVWFGNLWALLGAHGLMVVVGYAGALGAVGHLWALLGVCGCWALPILGALGRPCGRCREVLGIAGAVGQDGVIVAQCHVSRICFVCCCAND